MVCGPVAFELAPSTSEPHACSWGLRIHPRMTVYSVVLRQQSSASYEDHATPQTIQVISESSLSLQLRLR